MAGIRLNLKWHLHFFREIFSLADRGSTEEVWTRPDVQGTGSKPLYVLIKGTISGYQRRRRVLYYPLYEQSEKDCSRHEFAKTQALNLVANTWFYSMQLAPNGLYARYSLSFLLEFVASCG